MTRLCNRHMSNEVIVMIPEFFFFAIQVNFRPRVLPKSCSHVCWQAVCLLSSSVWGKDPPRCTGLQPSQPPASACKPERRSFVSHTFENIIFYRLVAWGILRSRQFTREWCHHWRGGGGGGALMESLTTWIENRQLLLNLLSFRQKRFYSKKSKRYRVNTVKVAKDYSYIPQLQRNILGKRLESGGGLARRRSLRPDDPRALGLLPGVVPPPTAELAQAQIRRGQVCQPPAYSPIWSIRRSHRVWLWFMQQ